MLRVFIPGARRECQRINYTRRRTGNRLLDTGSTPVYSMEKPAFMLAFKDWYWLGTQLGTQTNIRIIREESSISASQKNKSTTDRFIFFV